MVIAKTTEAVCAGTELSVTLIVTLTVPAAVGIPLITPLLDSDSPAGRVAGGTDQLRGVAVVGAAVNVCEYAVLMRPLASEVVVITCGMLIVKGRLTAVCAGLPLSKARTVKVKLPVTDGVPLITPPSVSDNPGGNAPVFSDQ